MNKEEKKESNNDDFITDQKLFDFLYTSQRRAIDITNPLVGNTIRRDPLLIVIDTETTGLPTKPNRGTDAYSKTNQIIQLSAVVVHECPPPINGYPIKLPKEFDRMIRLRPRSTIFSEASKINDPLNHPIIEPAASRVNGLTDEVMANNHLADKHEKEMLEEERQIKEGKRAPVPNRGSTIFKEFIRWVNDWKEQSGCAMVFLASFSGSMFDPEMLESDLIYWDLKKDFPVFIRYVDMRDVFSDGMPYNYFYNTERGASNKLVDLFFRATGYQVSNKIAHNGINDCKMLDLLIRHALKISLKASDFNVLTSMNKHTLSPGNTEKVREVTARAHSRMKGFLPRLSVYEIPPKSVQMIVDD